MGKKSDFCVSTTFVLKKIKIGLKKNLESGLKYKFCFVIEKVMYKFGDI